jgi:hypothetical protein
MKFLVALLLGIASGASATLAILYFNPVSPVDSDIPLMVSDRRQIILNYSVVAADSIMYTNNGESRVQPVPRNVAQLWEPAIRDTEILVTEMFDYRGLSLGVGIKFSSWSEDTRLLNNEVLVDSAWHIELPHKGTLFIGQRENRWDFLREVVVPAHWNSSDSWKGSWRGLLSVGPNALGTAAVQGGSGSYAGRSLEAVEYLNARAFSASAGPVAADGQVIIEIPELGAQVALEGEDPRAASRRDP